MKKIVIAIFFLSVKVFANDINLNFCSESLQTLPTQAGGRIKPLYVLANETFKFITPVKKPWGFPKTTAFCVGSLMVFGQNSSLDLPLKVEHVEAKKLLGMKEGESSLSADILIEKMLQIRMTAIGIKENNSYKKELSKILNRISVYQQLIDGKLWQIASKDSEGLVWNNLGNSSFEGLETTINGQTKLVKNNSEANFMLEYYYFKFHPFSWAMLVALLTIFALVLRKKKTIGINLAYLTIAMQIAAMVVRIFISGRAPITNMYETVMFSGFGALTIGLFLTLKKDDISFILGGLGYNVLCLFMMMFANNMLDASIKPLVPVLRDNFWLSTHVTTIILSYAALALSWMLANITLIKGSFGRGLTSTEQKRQVKIIYTAIQIGVVLLSAGIILGGVWADYSWGRFWGWDPKETWSLIVLLIYMAILHGKYTKYIDDKKFVPFVAFAFLSVMMAWFGVNYILAAGLHSYGFSEGGAIFLGTFFAVQIGLLVATLLKQKELA